MPFKSKAQQRFMFAAESRGDIPKGTARRWAHHTPNIKDLPEKKRTKKTRTKKAMLVCLVSRLQKSAAWRVSMRKIAEYTKRAAGETPQATYPGPMQPMSPAQPSGAAMVARRSDDIAKSISQFGSTDRGQAAYERLAQYRRGAVKGYAAASQPDAKRRFQEALGPAASEEKEKEAGLERIGTPYMDGFLRYCIEQDFTGDQVADLLEKTAEMPGRAGEEAKGLLERMLAL